MTQYPLFELSVRNDQRDKAGQHGIWDFFSFYGQRNVTMQGVILANSHSDLIQFQDKIREVLTLPSQPIADTNDGYITINWTDVDSEAWSINAKITQDVQFSRNIGNKLRSSFFISLKADNPYILSTTEYSEDQLRGWKGGQMLLPAFLGSKINLKYNEVLNIYQTGTADAPGTYRLYGPGTDLKLTKLIESFSSSTTISDFSSGWSGGTDDTVHFQTSSKAQKLTSTGAQDTMSLTSALDLSDPDFITFYFYVDDKDNFALGDYTTGENYIKLIDNVGVDEFVLELSGGNDTIRDGWNYFVVLKQEFKSIGSPSWSTITAVELSIKAKTGTTLNITFDDLRNRNISFTEKKLEINAILGSSEYVDFDVFEGTIIKSDDSDMSSYLTSDSEWFYISPRQNLIYCSSSDADPVVTYEFPYTFRDPVDSTNIIGYWHFDDKDLTQVTDYVGNYNGTFVASGLNYLNSTINGSQYYLDYPGTGGYITMQSPFQDIVLLATGAISFWVKFDSYAADMMVIDRFFGYTGTTIKYDQSDDKLLLDYELDGGAISMATAAGFAATYGTGTWINVIVNFDVSSAVTMYVDNVLVDTDSTTGTKFNTGLLQSRLGMTVGGADNLVGGLDEIRYYSGTLDSDTRIALNNDAAQEKYKNQLNIKWNNSKL